MPLVEYNKTSGQKVSTWKEIEGLDVNETTVTTTVWILRICIHSRRSRSAEKSK